MDRTQEEKSKPKFTDDTGITDVWDILADFIHRMTPEQRSNIILKVNQKLQEKKDAEEKTAKRDMD